MTIVKYIFLVWQGKASSEMSKLQIDTLHGPNYVLSCLYGMMICPGQGDSIFRIYGIVGIAQKIKHRRQKHYNDITWTSQNTGNSIILFNRLFISTIKKATDLHLSGPLWEESTGNRWIFLIKTSNAESISMWWFRMDATSWNSQQHCVCIMYIL